MCFWAVCVWTDGRRVGALFKHNKLVRMCGSLWDAVFTLRLAVPALRAYRPRAPPVFSVQFVVLYNTKFSEGCNWSKSYPLLQPTIQLPASKLIGSELSRLVTGQVYIQNGHLKSCTSCRRGSHFYFLCSFLLLPSPFDSLSLAIYSWFIYLFL
jgi:hypothetical protein